MSDAEIQEKLARGKVKAFVGSFGERAFHLACHAAIPVVLGADLLHLLRINFFLDPPEPLPYTVESDILLSPLCNEIGGSLYEIPPTIRDLLLRELAATPAYGEQRIREIASLLLQYSERSWRWKENPELERGQQLTALNFLDAPSAKRWLEAAQERIHATAPSEREWFIAMREDLLKIDALLQEQQSSDAENREEPGLTGLNLLTSIPTHQKSIGKISWSWDGNRLAWPSADGAINVWDVRAGRLLHTFRGQTDRVTCLSWSPVINYLAAGSDGSIATIWDTESGEPIQTIRGPSSVESLSWSADGRLLALGLSDSRVMLYHRAGSVRRTLAGPEGSITSLKWSPDASRLAATSEREQMIYVWTVVGRHQPARSFALGAFVLDIDWSSDGQTLVAGCGDHTVRLCDARDGRHLRILTGHTDIVNAVSFSADGRLIASNSHDQTVRIWRSDTGENVSVLKKQGMNLNVAGVAFNPKKLQLATLGHQDAINIWAVDTNVFFAADRVTESLTTSAKIVLLGEDGVGKTSLARALVTNHPLLIVEGEVERAALTKLLGATDLSVGISEKVYLADSLSFQLTSSLKCETFIWDAGLPDPLLSRLHLFDASLILVLFDRRLDEEGLTRQESYWKLVAARKRVVWIGIDKGEKGAGLTAREVEQYFNKRRREYASVNLQTGDGFNELVELLQQKIRSRLLETTVKIKSALESLTLDVVRKHVLTLKEQKDQPKSTYFYSFSDLLDSLNPQYGRPRFSRRQLRQALRHLQRQGLIQLLRGVYDQEIVWLDPGFVNQLLESLVKAARQNSRHPGTIEESLLMNLMYADPLLNQLDRESMENLLQATVHLLIQHRICSNSFRDLKPVLEFSALAKQEKTQARLAQSAFDKMLEWLSPDRDNAGLRYEEIRRRLIRLFASRGVPFAEDLADEAIERVTRKVDQLTGTYTGDPALYFYGVAQNLYLEHARKSVSPNLPPVPAQSVYDASGTLEREHECLERCLERLTQHDRELILGYYAEDRARIAMRNRMSERLKIPLHSLRLRASRIRRTLGECIRNCIAKDR